MEIDPAKVTNDPGTIYEAASSMFTRLAYCQKHVDLAHKRSTELLKNLEFFCKAQVSLLDAQVVNIKNQMKSEIKGEDPYAGGIDLQGEIKLDEECVKSYLQRFEIISNKMKKLEPMLKFTPPTFNTTTDLGVFKKRIDSPFGNPGPIGPAIRIIGKLQSKDMDDLGLVAINTAERTCIGRFDVVDKNGEILKPHQADDLSLQEADNSHELSLTFSLRKVLYKRYVSAICHGSRLICDTEVYTKSYELQ